MKGALDGHLRSLYKVGDFFQKRNLEHVMETLEKIRKEIREEVLPDLSWAGYRE